MSKTYRHPCPDGEKVVYKSVDDAVPLYIPGWQGQAGTSIENLAGGQVKLDVAYQTRIQGLLYSLDELNQTLMMKFRLIYVHYQSDPCNNGQAFARGVQQLLQEQERLGTLRIKIRALVQLAELSNQHHDQILALFHEIVTQVGGPAVADAAVLEIDETRSVAKSWVRG